MAPDEGLCARILSSSLDIICSILGGWLFLSTTLTVGSMVRNQRSCLEGVCKAALCCYVILISGSDHSIDEEQIENG